MIQLNPDSLLFQMPTGEAIPCSAETVTVELIGDALEQIDPDIVRNATAAVLHYFKVDLGRDFVSVAEFSRILADVLRKLGVDVKAAEAPEPPSGAGATDLRRLADAAGDGFELAFFPRLREELRGQLDRSQHLMRFVGLRACVKQLTGAKRWGMNCQRMSDQINEFLRECFSQLPPPEGCAMVVTEN